MKSAILKLNGHFRFLCICLFTLSLFQLPAMAEEPTQDEICGALESKMKAINGQLRETREKCERRAYKNDPFLAMQCLGQYAASGGTGNMSVKITRCEKIACEKASSQPGYVCDYVSDITMPGNVAMSGSLGTMASTGSIGQGRFVQTNNGWLFIPIQQ